MRTVEQTSDSQCSFLLDGMLGRLARWLRLAGFDTLYYPDKNDDELIHEAVDTGRARAKPGPRIQLECF